MEINEEQKKKFQEAMYHLPPHVVAAIDCFLNSHSKKTVKYYGINPITKERRLEKETIEIISSVSDIFCKYHHEAAYFTIAIDTNGEKPKLYPAYCEKESGETKILPEEWMDNKQMWQDMADVKPTPDIEIEEEGLPMELLYLQYREEKLREEKREQENKEVKHKWYQIWKQKK